MLSPLQNAPRRQMGAASVSSSAFCLAEKPELDEMTLERVLEELETMCYENMNIAIETEEGLGIEYDEDVVCDVCRSPEGEDGNEMVFCDKCNVCVHQVSPHCRFWLLAHHTPVPSLRFLPSLPSPSPRAAGDPCSAVLVDSQHVCSRAGVANGVLGRWQAENLPFLLS